MSAAPYPSVGVITADDLSTDGRVFPQLPGMDFLVEKAPMFSTGVRTSSSGREVRTSYYPYPLYRFKVQANFLRQYADKNELAKLMGFYNSMKGRYGSFFYKDQEDYEVTDEPFGTGDGTTRIFQLKRRVGKDTPYAIAEPVYACWEYPEIQVDGVVQHTGVSMDTWGQVTFSSAPANGDPLTWTGKFLYVCRFEEDELSFQQMMSLLWSQEGLTFMSTRP